MIISLFEGLSALAIFMLSLFSGWPALVKPQAEPNQHTLPMGEALAVGVFLGIGLMHLLPEAHDRMHEMGFDYPWACLIAGMVFLFLLWVEHIGREWVEHHGLYNRVFAGMATLMFSFHSVLAGVVLGLESDWTMQLPMLIAIIAHKWAESFALAIHINRSQVAPQTSRVLFMVFCCMTPMGILLGESVASDSLFSTLMLAISAGVFLYLGTLHGLFKAVLVQRCCSLKHYMYVILGFVIMALVALFA